MVLILLLIIAAMVLGILGAVVEGLLYLLVIGIGILVLAAVIAGVKVNHRRHREIR